MEIQNVIFDYSSLTSKISTINLTKKLLLRFTFSHDEGLLLARFMVEQPSNYKNDVEGEDEEPYYRLDIDKQLSHAKVISKLQSVMSALKAERKSSE